MIVPQLFKRNILTLVKFYLGYPGKRAWKIKRALAEFLNKLSFAMLHFRQQFFPLVRRKKILRGWERSRQTLVTRLLILIEDWRCREIVWSRYKVNIWLIIS